MVILLNSFEKIFEIKSVNSDLSLAKAHAERLCKENFDGHSYGGWETCEEQTESYEMGGGDPNYICNFGGYFVFKVPETC